MSNKNRIKRTKDVESGTVTFVAGKHKLVCNIDDVPPEILRRLALHGVNDRVGDAAGGKDTDATAFEEMARVWKSLQDGKWSLRQTGSKRVGDLARALARRDDISEADAARQISKLPAKQKKALIADPVIIAYRKRIRAERALADADKVIST